MLAPTALIVAGTLTGVPDHAPAQLQLRANIVDGFNLPPGSSINSGTPSLGDDGTVAMRAIVLGDTGRSGLWVGLDGTGGVVYQAPVDRFVEDPCVRAGRVAFELFDVFTDGVFVHDIASGATTQVVAPGAPFGIEAVTKAQIATDGALGFRADVGPGNAYILVDTDGTQSMLATDVTGPYGFLFTASFNDARVLAGKVRLGGTGGSQPDEIRAFDADGSTLLAIDRDGDASSPYAGFDNSIDLAENGLVAFIASLVGGGRGVYRTDGVTTTEIATTADPLVSDISFFPPALNESGLVVFRGFDATGGDAVFLGDGTTLVRLIGEHDTVETDLGLGRIDQHDGSVTFGGAVAINAAGDVAFHCTLTPADNDQIEWGSGVFVMKAETAVPGDVNGDGIVGVEDLLAVLAAWGPCSGCPEDLDGDGTVGVTDLLEVLGGWGDG